MFQHAFDAVALPSELLLRAFELLVVCAVLGEQAVQVAQLDLLALELRLHCEEHILLAFELFSQFLLFSALQPEPVLQLCGPGLQNQQFFVQQVPRVAVAGGGQRLGRPGGLRGLSALEAVLAARRD